MTALGRDHRVDTSAGHVPPRCGRPCGGATLATGAPSPWYLSASGQLARGGQQIHGGASRRAQRLRDNTPGAKLPTTSVRLEQERIGFAWLERALAALVSKPSVEPVFAPEFEVKK